MSRRDLAELLALAAVWGASFLFMRVAAEPFGPAALTWVRVGGAALVLMPLLLLNRQGASLREHWRVLAMVGLSSSALPFALYGFALAHVTAPLAAVFNAATPLFGAVVAWAWLGDRLDRWRVLGLVIGFAGVFGLAAEKAGLRASTEGGQAPAAVGACLLAALSYGWSASYTKRYAGGVPPLALAAGSQVAATLAWTLPALWWWPATNPSTAAWTAAAMVAVVSTGLAYIVYFRLLARVGPANTLTVTYLVPMFAIVWGVLFLDEWPTPAMLLGCATILLGIALATGWWRPGRRTR